MHCIGLKKKRSIFKETDGIQESDDLPLALNREILKLSGNIFDGKPFHIHAVRIRKAFLLYCVMRWDMVTTVKAWLRPNRLLFLANTWGGGNNSKSPDEHFPK